MWSRSHSTARRRLLPALALLACLRSAAADVSAPPPDYQRAADYSARHGGRAVLVQKSGQVVFERYDNGWRPNLPHPLASGTKSFTGVLAMLAVQDGLLTLDEKAADTLTEWREHPQKSQITVRHLLELSSGLAPGDKELGGGRLGTNLLGYAAAERARRLGLTEAGEGPPNKFRAALDLPITHATGARFQYGPSHFCAFGELLQRKLARSGLPQKTVLAYLRERLLEPVGIPLARIGRDRAGNPNLPGGMLLTAREWAKFGQFVLDRGATRQADGTLKPWLKPELLDECFQPSRANPSYGLTWWLGAQNSALPAIVDSGSSAPVRSRLQSAATVPLRGPDGKPVRVYMAAGLGKQRLYVIPDHELVVVRFAEGTREGLQFQDRVFLGAILGSE